MSKKKKTTLTAKELKVAADAAEAWPIEFNGCCWAADAKHREIEYGGRRRP